jgi:hypothetical protein
MTDERKPSEGELARLADGTLPVPRQAELRAQVQGSPELEAALAEQQRAVAMLRALDQPAPDALRARVADMTGVGTETAAARPKRRGRGWRAAIALPAATALAVVAAAVVLLVNGTTSAPTVPQTARLALAAATLPAPGVNSSNPEWLKHKGSGVPFPNWYPHWRTTGARTDTLSGRRVETVFYTRGNDRIGYAIVAGAPLKEIGGATAKRYGVSFTLGRDGHARLVTWRRDGHTCVIAGRSVGYGTLLNLASADEQTPVSSATLDNTSSRGEYL